jgi:hypothetical protein
MSLHALSTGVAVAVAARFPGNHDGRGHDLPAPARRTTIATAAPPLPLGRRHQRATITVVNVVVVSRAIILFVALALAIVVVVVVIIVSSSASDAPFQLVIQRERNNGTVLPLSDKRDNRRLSTALHDVCGGSTTARLVFGRVRAAAAAADAIGYVLLRHECSRRWTRRRALLRHARCPAPR